MIAAEVVRHLFALRAVEPFARLDNTELLLIAQHVRFRSFAAGRVVIPAGGVAEALFVCIEGEALLDGAPTGAVFDAPGLLFGCGARGDYVAGPEGLGCLIIAKPHVFTIARECPEFVVGLRDLTEGARP